MQYVRSISGSVSKTWNSLNPATLSGAIDVIVVEQEDGSLACSPFHVRFGKFSLLRPSEKKVEFTVNGSKQNYAMKLGEGGEAFFVFETSDKIPEALLTSPPISPEVSPETKPTTTNDSIPELYEPEPLDLAASDSEEPSSFERRPQSMYNPHMAEFLEGQDGPTDDNKYRIDPEDRLLRPVSGDWSGHAPASFGRSVTDQGPVATKSTLSQSLHHIEDTKREYPSANEGRTQRSTSPPAVQTKEAVARAVSLSKRLWGSNIPTHITDGGDLMLDMAGYKSSEEDALRAEVVARKILSEELEGNYDIGALIGADENGNIWIYGSEEAKEAADRKINLQALGATHMSSSTDALSDPGYQSDDSQGDTVMDAPSQTDADSGVGMAYPANLGKDGAPPRARQFAKTLRLTSDQLRELDLKPGPNDMSFSVNRATCQAQMYLWKHNVPVVISDIDGTITKSDALGHVLNMIGRDWTHLGVAKLYTDIIANGYNILYLTSRSVGQADTTRTYLSGVIQDDHRLPRGPVIMSPDRTMAALRREVYLRKPEVFKMACLRDIMNLYHNRQTPFYAGFGNRLTDALSYRSVNIPSTRIFTINSNAEVSLDLLSLYTYKTGYLSMRELVDQFFPAVGLLVESGGEEFTDFNYWRDRLLDIDELSDSESETETVAETHTVDDDDDDDDDPIDEGEEEEEDEEEEDMEASFISQASREDTEQLDTYADEDATLVSVKFASDGLTAEPTEEVAGDEIAKEDDISALTDRLTGTSLAPASAPIPRGRTT